MKIWTHSYSFGSLIRVEFSDGVRGFADVRTFESLGDPSLSETLSSLKREPNRLAKNALHCARLDGVARAEKRSLFDNLVVPESHYFLGNRGSVAEAVALGYSAIKVKVTPETSLEPFLDCPLKVRLDANNRFSRRSFEAWFDRRLTDRVELIEDPFPIEEGWEAPLVPYAADRQGSTSGASFVIHKPALEGLTCNEELPVVVTGYLGHPLGDAFAAYAAGLLKALTSGLQSSPLGKQEGPRFISPEGTGLGFDALLSTLSWELL